MKLWQNERCVRMYKCKNRFGYDYLHLYLSEWCTDVKRGISTLLDDWQRNRLSLGKAYESRSMGELLVFVFWAFGGSMQSLPAV